MLIALGGGVLTGFTMMMFGAIEIDAGWLAEGWLIPCGAMGAVIVGSWLVEAKQSVIENMAPVLTRLFTPLFTVVPLAFLATLAWTGSPVDVERELLIGFDLLLAVVLGLVLYAASARDPVAPPDFFDRLQLLLVVSALVVDAVALSAIAARISEFGFTPNRVAALGENLILLVNLVWSAWLYARFILGRGSFATLESWQTSYLPVYAAWAALVVVEVLERLLLVPLEVVAVVDGALELEGRHLARPLGRLGGVGREEVLLLPCRARLDAQHVRLLRVLRGHDAAEEVAVVVVHLPVGGHVDTCEGRLALIVLALLRVLRLRRLQHHCRVVRLGRPHL